MVNETVGQRLCAIVIPNESVDGKSFVSTCVIELCVPLCKTKYANGTGTCRIQVPQRKPRKKEERMSPRAPKEECLCVYMTYNNCPTEKRQNL
ncbi:unnamed protein product [Arabidopsis lyrata]|nr:unnamed protein product [Arabidopsis lyrata]